MPITFYQPCDWDSSPDLVGETIWSLPHGAIDDDIPYPCGVGLIGGNGSSTHGQTSATCAGFCPDGLYSLLHKE